MKISEKISFLRKSKKLSQEQLAIKLDVSRQAVYKWEAGLSVPEIDKIKKLAVVFGVSYDFLLNDSLDTSALESSDFCKTQEEQKSSPASDIPCSSVQEDRCAHDSPEATTYYEQPSLAYVKPEPSVPTPPAKSNRKQRLGLIITLCVIGGAILLSLFIFSMVKLLNRFNFFADISSDNSDTNAYEIKFIMPNGETLKTESVSYGACATAPTPDSINGYSFKGWYSSNTGSSVVYNESMTFFNDVEFIAVYEPITYQITYNLNGGALNSGAQSSYTVESSFALPTASKTGYDFIGWFKDSSFKTKIDKIEPGSYGNLELYACFLEYSNKISYVLYGGTNSTENPVAFSVGQALTLKDPSHSDENAVFAGWYEDSSFTKPVTNVPTHKATTVTLYAKWAHPYFDIVYNQNGCTITNCLVSQPTSEITVPDTFLGAPVCYILANTFNGCEIGALHIGKNINELAEGCFNGAQIEVIYIKRGTSLIYTSAFYGCSGLQSIEIDPLNSSYCDIDGVAFNKAGTRLLKYPCDRTAASYTLPSSTNYIEANAFSGCTNLVSVTFSDRVGGIDNGAFQNCTWLQSVDLGDILNYIGKDAFRGCTKLEEIYFPSKLYSIGNYAFEGCSSLKTVTFDKGVDVLGYSVFANCSLLESCTLGESCTEISSRVFNGCVSLRSIIIPGDVSKIGSEAFIGCSALETVIINQNAIWSVYFEKTGGKITLTSENVANPATVAQYFVSTYIKGIWKNEGKIETSSTVKITYDAGAGTLEGSNSVEIPAGSIYPYHPTPSTNDSSKLFVGWFLNSGHTIPAEKYTVFTNDTTLYASYLTLTPCISGDYNHSFGSFKTATAGTCESVALLSSTCSTCQAMIYKYGDRDLSNHTSKTAPYIEGFKAVIFCHGCETKMQSKEFENVTLSALGSDPTKNIDLSGDVFGAGNLVNMINGNWDESAQQCIAPKGSSEVVLDFYLDSASVIDYIYVKGRGSASFFVSVKYEDDSDYTFLGSGSFLSSQENAAEDRQIPFVDVTESGTKGVVAVRITINANDASSYLEEIGLFYAIRA